jgi:hypothetical protein
VGSSVAEVEGLERDVALDQLGLEDVEDRQDRSSELAFMRTCSPLHSIEAPTFLKS